MSLHLDYDESDSSALFLLKQEKKKKVGPLRTLQQAYNQIKLLVCAWLLLVVWASGILTAGVIFCTSAQAYVQRLQDSYEADITEYNGTIN